MVGLVIGSMTPDIGYTLRQFGLDKFSHSALGSLIFCLPVGFLAAHLVFAIRRPLAQLLPTPHRQALVPLCASSFPAWGRLALSLFIGIWTHIVCDLLTHESALLAAGRESVRHTFAAVDRTGLKVYHVLWILVSCLCLGLLGLGYARFLKRTTGSVRLFDSADPADRRRALVWAALVVVPYLIVIPFTYHVFEPGGFRVDRYALYGSLQPYLLLLAVELTMLGFVARSRERKGNSPTAPGAKESSDMPAPPC